MNSLKQGQLGEAKVIAELVSLGYEIFVPIFSNTSNDLVVLKDGVLHRVEVKSTRTRDAKSSSWSVKLATIRSNRSVNTTIKFDGNRSDILAVYIVPEDRVLLLKSSDYHGMTVTNIKPNNA